MEIWIPVITALAGGITAILAVILSGAKKVVEEWFDRWAKQNKREGYAHGLRLFAEFERCFDQLKAIPGVGRMLLFTGTNCGGKPSAGKAYRVRAHTGWSIKDPAVHQRYDFDLTVDPAYVEMLIKMITEGMVVNTVASLPPSSILKSFYTEEGIKQSILFFLKCSDVELTYVSIGNYDGEFTSDQRMRLEIIVQRMRSILNEL